MTDSVWVYLDITTSSPMMSSAMRGTLSLEVMMVGSPFSSVSSITGEVAHLHTTLKATGLN